MSHKIIVDSSCDLTDEMKTWKNLVRVPLTLEVDDYKTMDDENFNQDDFVEKMQAYDGAAKSACPSIDAWLQAYEGDEDELYVVTLTSKLSGTYNSAVQAKDIYLEEHNDGKKIHIIDSMSAVSKETLIAMKVKELKDSGKSFDEVITLIDKFINEDSSLYFCLDDLNNLRKNGRISNLQAAVLNALKVKLILKEQDGFIEKATQDISSNRAIIKIANIILKNLSSENTSEYRIAVSYCHCEERAKMLVKQLTDRAEFKSVDIMSMGGLNTIYANVGGIVIAYGK